MASKSVFMFIFALIVGISTNFLENSDISIAAGDNIYTELRNPENILCRGCGSDVSSTDFLISKLSPSSHYAFNDTLFNREMVLIQVVSHDPIFQFPVITSTESTCQGYGEWQVDNSWFPGYRWKLCICPECGEFLGWIFESVYLGNHQESPHEVFCLVLTSVIGESCIRQIKMITEANQNNVESSTGNTYYVSASLSYGEFHLFGTSIKKLLAES